MLGALRAQRARLDNAIGALEALEPAPNGNGHKRPNGKPAAHYGKVSPDKWGQAERWWRAGVSAVEIGRRIGITDVSVHYHAKVHKWPKRKRGAKAVAETEKLAGRVRCQGCGQLTDTDPCACGEKVAFK